MRADVAVGPHQHADVAEEARGRGRSIWAIVVEASTVARLFDHDRRRQIRRELFVHADRARAGPPPPCGPLKVLCGLKCIMSAPKSPGRAMPRMAFMLAPSR